MRELLAAAQALNLPPATWRDVVSISGEDAAAMAVELDGTNDYFSKFIPPQKVDGHRVCVCCRKRYPTDQLMGFLGASETNVEWSLAHGEAHCRECGYPSRVYHYDIKGANGEVLITRLTATLEYHPAGISFDQKEGAA